MGDLAVIYRAKPAAGPLLTTCQKRVLELASQGWANKQTARLLCLCQRTVEFHLDAINRTLGTHSRTHAVMVAIRDGLIAMPEHLAPQDAVIPE